MIRILQKATLFLVLVLACAALVHAQKSDIKFGKVSLNELKMSVYDKDTAAEAVILYDKGYYTAHTGNFKQFTRIKILKTSGLKRADMILHAPKHSNVKGFTYNLSESGEIIIDKLKASAVFKEKIFENHKEVRVVMPNVKVGSVIDIELVYLGIPYQWYFQDNIPTIWSELTLESVYELSVTKHGLAPLHISEDLHWAAKDVPAIKAEPYMGAIKDYVSRLELRFNLMGNLYKWSDASKVLMKDEDFGKRLDDVKFLDFIADSIANVSKNEKEKVKHALVHIQKQMRWNGYNSLFAYRPLSESYAKKSLCASASINLTLVALLRKLNLEAYPLVLSSRDYGIVSQHIPDLNKLNHTIAYVKAGSETFMIDATEKNAPIGLLPVKCLNYWGWLIGTDLYEEKSLEPKYKYKRTALSQISIPPDLSTVEYQLNISHEGYAALEKRNAAANEDYDEQQLKSSFENQNDVIIRDYQVHDRENVDKAVKEKMLLYQQVSKSGNFLFINPIIGQQYNNNPFILEARVNPIDFVYPISETYITTVTIPAGYELESIPQSISVVMPEQKARLLYEIKRINDTLQLTYIFEINQQLFLNTRYQEIKGIFEQYISKTKEQIVLKKI